MGNLPLQSPWITAYFSSELFHIMSLSSTIIGLILHPILFSLHVYRKLINPFDQEGNPRSDTHSREQSSKKSVKTKSSKTKSKTKSKSLNSKFGKSTAKTFRLTLIITPLLTILFAFIASLISLFNTQKLINNENSCLFITQIQNISWLIPKLSIYHVLILRLYMAFYGSAYQYNKYIMITAFIFVTIMTIILIIGTFFDVDSYFLYPSAKWCYLVIPTWLKITPVIIDLIFTIMCLILFINPLSKLIKTHTNNDKTIHPSTYNISRLITKLMLLTGISIITNIIGGLMFTITDIALATYVDTAINPICLILMESSNTDVYKTSCFCCHICCHKLLNFKVSKIANSPWDPKDVGLCQKSVKKTKNEKEIDPVSLGSKDAERNKNIRQLNAPLELTAQNSYNSQAGSNVDIEMPNIKSIDTNSNNLQSPVSSDINHDTYVETLDAGYTSD